MKAPFAVLLVEDNPVSLKVSTFLLKKLEVDVHVATSGEEAVRLAGENPYHLILMDIELPGISGLEAAREIRKQEQDRGPGTRGRPPALIVAMTAHEGNEVERESLEAGMDSVTDKPLKPERIRELLERFSPRAPQPAAETPAASPEEPAATECRPEAVADNTEPAETEKAPERILEALEESKRRAVEDAGDVVVRHLMVFALGDEKYGLDVKHLKNVMWAGNITPVPDVPSHVLGVMNIRGDIISVVDLKQLLGLDLAPPARGSVMVTAENGVEVGFLVDSLDNIVDLPLNSIDPPMITFEKECVEFIDGEARVDERLMTILNYSKIMASEQMTGSEARTER